MEEGTDSLIYSYCKRFQIFSDSLNNGRRNRLTEKLMEERTLRTLEEGTDSQNIGERNRLTEHWREEQTH